MARAGTLHRNAFESVSDGAPTGVEWIDAPQLWQNCAFASSFVPQLLQNRGSVTEAFVAMVQGLGSMCDIARVERTIDYCAFASGVVHRRTRKATSASPPTTRSTGIT